MKVNVNPVCNKFKITIHFEWIADPQQIFGYEGQGPKNPTVDDVVQEINKCKNISQFINDWHLEETSSEDADFIVTVTPVL